jgi:hypothetical protein
MDPLRPFTGLIRTLWKSTAPSTTQKDALASASTAGAEEARSEAALALEGTTLRTQIRARLRRIGLNDPRLAREVFVETVLTAELGESLSRDPGFTDMVKRLAEHMGADERVGDRLHSLLCSLADEPPQV